MKTPLPMNYPQPYMVWLIWLMLAAAIGMGMGLLYGIDSRIERLEKQCSDGGTHHD